MAISSDWIEKVQSSAIDAVPSRAAWMADFARPADFVEGAPFIIAPSPMARTPVERPSDPAPDDEMHSETGPAIDPVAEAFARGVAEGRAASEAEAGRRIEENEARMRDLRLAFQTLDQAAMDSLSDELAETVIALCDAAIEGFVPDVDDLRTRCGAASARLGEAASGCVLHLNPEDHASVEDGALGDWRIVDDANVERGGLRFEGVDGAITDGPTQWRRAIRAALKG